MSSTKPNKTTRTAFSFAAIDTYLETNIVLPVEKLISGRDMVEWGTRNAYPDYLLDLYNNVPTLRSIINGNIDYVIIDELPAEYIVSKNSGLACLPLYYSGATEAEDAPVEEQYAICVTKGNDELLKAINEVLEDLIKEDKINKMVMDHMIKD